MKQKNKKGRIDRLVTSGPFLIGMLLVGLLILVYPLISDWYYKQEQHRVIHEYEEMVENLPTEEGKIILEQAYQVNAMLAGFGSEFYSQDRSEALATAYQDGKLPGFFRPGNLIGTVKVPTADVELPLYSGSDDDILQSGAGVMLNTSLPVGGDSTHSVVTAHRGLPKARLFTDLDRVKKGDVFFIQVLDKPHAYEVDRIQVIKPTETESLGIIPGEDRVTLLTCHPYMVNSERLTVSGHRIPYTEEIVRKVADVTREQRFSLFLHKYKEYVIGIGIFLILAMGVWLGEKFGKRRKEREHVAEERRSNEYESPKDAESPNRDATRSKHA